MELELNKRKIQKIICSLLFLASVLGNNKVFAKPEEINSHNFELASSLSRLNCILNHSHINTYLAMKGYIHLDVEYLIYDVPIIADCKCDDEAGVIEITLYFKCVCGEPLPSLVESREWFALKVYEIVMNLCREFIREDISQEDIKLVVKHSRTTESEGNTLFIWENGDIRYFPKFFASHL